MRKIRTSPKEIAAANERVCKIVAEKNADRITVNNEIKSKIGQLKIELQDSNREFKKFKSDICYNEGVSEKLVTRVVFGNIRELEEENTDLLSEFIDDK